MDAMDQAERPSSVFFRSPNMSMDKAARRLISLPAYLFCARLDEWAETAGKAEKEKMKELFLQSCQLEYGFWEMAYTVEDWPVEMGAVRL